MNKIQDRLLREAVAVSARRAGGMARLRELGERALQPAASLSQFRFQSSSHFTKETS
jgi:hypothetical protein